MSSFFVGGMPLLEVTAGGGTFVNVMFVVLAVKLVLLDRSNAVAMCDCITFNLNLTSDLGIMSCKVLRFYKNSTRLFFASFS